MPLRILISGAGIAGLSLAYWLSKLGHSVTVVERSPALRTNGLQLDLRGHGIEVMKRMGIEAAFRENSAPELGIQLVDTHGRRWAYFGANTTGKGSQSFTSEFEIMRGDFCRILHDAAKEKVRYIFGSSIERYKDGEESIHVWFTNGTDEEFDVVVGADGLYSRTRKMMFGSEGFHPLRENIAYLRIPKPIVQGEEYVATAYVAPGGKFVLTRRNNPDELQVYFSSKHVSERLEGVTRGDVDGEKAVFADEFRGVGWRTDEMLDAMKDSDDFYCERQGLVKLDRWSKGRVVLLGDAGFCSAASGMGTSAAVIGAYVLAGEIGRAGRTGDALEEYERKMRPHVERIQGGMKDGFWDGVRWKGWQVRAVYWVIWVAGLVRVDRVLGWMGDGGDGWELPDYEELRHDD